MPLLKEAARVAAAAVLAACAAAPAAAQGGKLPGSLTATAYDTGSSGFNIAVAVGKMLKDRHGTDLRVLPAGNDVARLAPLKANRAQLSAMGIGTYFAQEGVFEFGTKEWGPQPLRVILAATACNGLSLGVARDTGVKEIKDLKGKRVGTVVGAPALNQGAMAIIAFGGLAPTDVKTVEFSSYGAMWKGIINGEVDAAFASTISGQAREADSSPRGLVWPPAPEGDRQGWAQLHKRGPYFYPHKVTCGAAIPAGGQEMPAYPYPIFMAYATQPADLVHAVTKAMIEGYEAYKDGAPGAEGLELKRQNLAWVVPFHEGAVRAMKEAGAWTAAAEAHNRKLVERQETLAKAWEAFMKASPPGEAEAFAKAWVGKRKEALGAAGMDPVFE